MEKLNNKEIIKEVKEYIEYYINKNKEDYEECFLEEFDPNFLIIPYKNPFYEMFCSEEKFLELNKYCNDFNKILVEEMEKRGYKHCFCEEDIEFYK